MSKRGAGNCSPRDSPDRQAKRLRSIAAASGAPTEQNEGLTFRLREPAPAADAPGSLAVLAPAFRAVHGSWEAFDAALKVYSQATFQLYVIRTTTSVKRRNQRIAEGLAAPPAASQEADAPPIAPPSSERALIPERFEWYSKTLMCTHGWKSRRRGSGKRATASVRSTSCPARMCVTLQQRGAGDGDWQVVVTRHTRQHNHPLSKELYYYYLENRRIYDPELLAVGADASEPPADGAWTSSVDPRELLTTEPGPQMVPSVPDSQTPLPAVPTSAVAPITEGAAGQMTSESDAGEFVLRPDATATFVRATRASIKVHESWDAFQTYLTDYSEATNQAFRTRSTVSVAAKNAKTLERGDRADRSPEETAALLVPEGLKWYSKMLICCHGWKRKSRRKMVSDYYGATLSPLFQGEDAGGGSSSAGARKVCPATLLVRLERDGSGTWRVVINRQVVEHNHTLALDAYDADEAAAGIVQPIRPEEASVNSTGGLQTPAPSGSDQSNQRFTTVDREAVVRVPRLPSMFRSWEDFHENLKLYSDATYQLYCTRTTTSVATRNRKIMAIRQQLEAERSSAADADASASAAADHSSDTRLIPDDWQWYNKTLMCTHGWKRRRRGVGKRAAQVVRSTLCPVKICATLQYVETVGGEKDADKGDGGGESGGWRVVVTKHVVDHNHNLSRELYDHYRENRRIYDPELLAIDESNGAVVFQPKAFSIEMAGTPLPYQQPTGNAVAEEEGSIHHSSSSDVYPESAGSNGGNSFLQVGIMPAPPSIPSVVILPYQSSISSSMASSAPPPNLRQVASSSIGRSNPTEVSAGSAVATLAALAAPQPQMYVPYHMPEAVGSGGTILMNGGVPMIDRHTFSIPGVQAGNSVLSLACPIHNSSGALASASSGPGDNCTCFRFMPSPYVAIAPSRVLPPMMTAPPTVSFELPHVSGEHEYRELQDAGGDGHEVVEADDDADLEPISGAWTPGALVEIRASTVSESGETVWRAPPMAHRHATWDAFHRYVDEYSAATFQLFSVRTTTAVSSRNARILQQVGNKGDSDAGAPGQPDTAQRLRQLEAAGQILPAKFEWYAKTFLCTHGWKRRRRGVGKRVGHSVRSTQCPAKICATLQRSAHAHKWRVVVTKQELAHNHEISHAMYQKYSANRRVKDPEVMRAAEQLWRAGSTRRQVFEFIKERAPQVPILMKDVHNIVQRWKKTPAPGGQEEHVSDGRGDEEDAPRASS